MGWYLNPALTRMRREVNAAYPHRDKASDGTIGDAAHQASRSDHNADPDGSVDAWDMDVEVNGPGRAYAADVEAIKRHFEAHPSSGYWIHDDKIAFRDEGWKPRSYAYAGPNRNRHDKHVHFNTRSSHERVITPFGIDPGDDMDLTDKIKLFTGKDVAYSSEDITVANILASTNYYTLVVRNTLNALRAEVAALRTVIDALAAVVKAGGGNVDTAALLSAVDARLAALPSAETIADAVIAEIAS